MRFINNGTITAQTVDFTFPPPIVLLSIDPATGDNAFINNGSLISEYDGKIVLAPAYYYNNGIVVSRYDFATEISGTITGGTHLRPWKP